MKHLSSRSDLDIDSLQVDVATVTFRNGEADAVVSFRPKGSTDPASAMQIRYTLERKGGEWVVKSRSEAGGSPHGGAPPDGGLPPGHPPIPESPSGQK
jgi:hypothetical protein